ncbi:hypothetical protein SDC9_194756 [bioreactor metagenome]|uniref:Uncharacterized protein n=1 Tax=bioreactor metagenome TaxID=1076179 RepID=A0A645I8C7_9ZZZZ
MLSGSMHKVFLSISAKTGVAPKTDVVSADAKKVYGVVITSSPGPTPNAFSISIIASVPLATPNACLTPVNSAASFSNPFTLGPMIK